MENKANGSQPGLDTLENGMNSNCEESITIH